MNETEIFETSYIAMAPVPVYNTYPPTDEPSVRSLVITGLLILCFTSAIGGNFSQCALQYYARRLRFDSGGSTASQILIALLFTIQFLTALSLPAVIVDNLVQIWMFGMVSCASHFILLSVGRTATGWLIVLLFADQTQTVGKSGERRQRRYLIQFVGVLSALCLLVMVPSLRHLQVIEDSLRDEERPDMIVHIRTFKCQTVFGADGWYLTAVHTVEFHIDFLLPVVVCMLLAVYARRVWQRQMMVGGGDVPFLCARIRRTTAWVVGVYFGCYAPYWTAIWFLTAVQHFYWRVPDWLIDLVGDIALVCPYLLPAILWIPLSQLSADLHRQMRFQADMSASTTTFAWNALESVFGLRSRSNTVTYSTLCHSSPACHETSPCPRRRSLTTSSLNGLSRKIRRPPCYQRMQSLGLISPRRGDTPLRHLFMPKSDSAPFALITEPLRFSYV